MLALDMLFFWIAAIGGSVIFFVADALSPR